MEKITPHKEQRETVHEVYRYTDVEGNLIGEVRAEYEPIKIKKHKGGDAVEVRRVISLRMKSAKGNEIDIFLMAGVSNCKVFEISEVEDRGLLNINACSNDHKNNEILTSSFENPIGLAIFAHESGHKKQASNGALAQLGTLSIRRIDKEPTEGLDNFSYARARALLDPLFKLVPKARDIFDEKILKDLDDLEEKRKEMLTEIHFSVLGTGDKAPSDDLLDWLNEVNKLLDPIEKENLNNAEEELKQLFVAVQGKVSNVDILQKLAMQCLAIYRQQQELMQETKFIEKFSQCAKLPRQILERDADLFALKLMRKIKAEGVNLFKKIAISSDYLWGKNKPDKDNMEKIIYDYEEAEREHGLTANEKIGKKIIQDLLEGKNECMVTDLLLFVNKASHFCDIHDMRIHDVNNKGPGKMPRVVAD